MQKEFKDERLFLLNKKDASQWTRQDLLKTIDDCETKIHTGHGQKGRQEWIAIKKKLQERLQLFTETPAAEEEFSTDTVGASSEVVEMPTGKNKSRIMYMEYKGGGLTGPARIGRVRFSKTGKSIYYRDQKFQSLKGGGYKANYFDAATGEEYWISGPRKDGLDRLYGERQPVEIDEDVREEYWLTIRNLPAKVNSRLAWP